MSFDQDVETVNAAYDAMRESLESILTCFLKSPSLERANTVVRDERLWGVKLRTQFEGPNGKAWFYVDASLEELSTSVGALIDRIVEEAIPMGGIDWLRGTTRTWAFTMAHAASNRVNRLMLSMDVPGWIHLTPYYEMSPPYDKMEPDGYAMAVTSQSGQMCAIRLIGPLPPDDKLFEIADSMLLKTELGRERDRVRKLSSQ